MTQSTFTAEAADLMAPTGPADLNGASLGFAAAASSATRNALVMQGRASRSAYWWFYLAQVLIHYVLGFLLGLGLVVGGRGSSVVAAVSLALVLPVLVALVVASTSLLVRRLHDTGRSGWWVLMSLVPVLGWFWVFTLTLLPSQPHANQYVVLERRSPGGFAKAVVALVLALVALVGAALGGPVAEAVSTVDESVEAVIVDTERSAPTDEEIVRQYADAELAGLRSLSAADAEFVCEQADVMGAETLVEEVLASQPAAADLPDLERYRAGAVLAFEEFCA